MYHQRIGDQGIVTIADKGGDFQEVTFDNCTVIKRCIRS